MSRPEVNSEEWDRLNSPNPDVESEAFHHIVLHYQYLVEGTARKLQRKLPSYLEDSELISFGQMGLLKAVRRYKPDQGPFSKYASTVVYGAIIDGLRAADFAPRGLRRQQREMETSIQELQNEGVSQPTSSQIALTMGVDEEEVLNLQHKIQRADVSPHDPTRLGSVQGNESFLSRELCREFVVWLKEKDELTQKVIAMRYWAEMSIKQISQALGLSPEQVRVRHLDVLSGIIPLMIDIAQDE
jgi:RNA polymerase sigma factor for flagellar operon FliA